MDNPLEMKNKYYEWSNEVFQKSPFDLKTNNLLSLAVAMVMGNQGAVSYFYFSARKTGATPAELAAAADIVASASGLNLYSLIPTE